MLSTLTDNVLHVTGTNSETSAQLHISDELNLEEHTGFHSNDNRMLAYNVQNLQLL